MMEGMVLKDIPEKATGRSTEGLWQRFLAWLMAKDIKINDPASRTPRSKKEGC